MLRKLSFHNLIRISAALILVGEITSILTTPRHRCGDLAFRFDHPNRTFTVTPVYPKRTYTDLLAFSYHQRPERLGLNNANCPLLVTGTSGMVRRQMQFLKPHILREMIIRARSPHVVYIDWDANYIRRPRRPPGDVVVQTNPSANTTNTGFLFFFNAKKHIPIIDTWISFEKRGGQDQWTWALTERKTNMSIWRTQDGDYGENYNWNVLDKLKTTARCNRVIFHLTWFRFMLNVAIILAVLAKIYDLWSMETKGFCPRRVYLSLVLIVAVVCSILFKEQYHQQVDYDARYFSERICAIPEIGLLAKGAIVSRQDTTTGPNEFLRTAIRIFGLSPVASSLSFWFSLLRRLRTFARVMLAIEVVSLASLLRFKRSSRAESLFWCTYVLWRDYGAAIPMKDVIGKQRKNGEGRVFVGDMDEMLTREGPRKA